MANPWESIAEDFASTRKKILPYSTSYRGTPEVQAQPQYKAPVPPPPPLAPPTPAVAKPTELPSEIIQGLAELQVRGAGLGVDTTTIDPAPSQSIETYISDLNDLFDLMGTDLMDTELAKAQVAAEARIADPREQKPTFIDPDADPNAFRNVMFGLNPYGGAVLNLFLRRKEDSLGSIDVAAGQRGNRVWTPQLRPGFFGSEENLGRLYPITEAIRNMSSPGEFLAIQALGLRGASASVGIRSLAPAAKAVGPPIVGRALELGTKAAAAVVRPFATGKWAKFALPSEIGASFLAHLGISELNKALPENTPTYVRVLASVAAVVISAVTVTAGPRAIISTKNTAKVVNDVKKAMEVQDTLVNNSAWQNSRNAAQRYKDAVSVTRAAFKAAKEKGYQGPEVDFSDVPSWRSPEQEAAEAEWRYTDLEEMGRAVPRHPESGGGVYREPFTREQFRLVSGGMDGEVGKSLSELSEEVNKLVDEVADAEKAAKSWGLGEKAPKGVTQEQRKALEQRNADEVDRLEKIVEDAVARRDAARDRFNEAKDLARGGGATVTVEGGPAGLQGELQAKLDVVSARRNAQQEQIKEIDRAFKAGEITADETMARLQAINDPTIVETTAREVPTTDPAAGVAGIIPEEIPQVHGRGDYLKALENKLTAKLPKEVKGDFIGQSETGAMEPVPARIYGDYAIVKNPNKFVGYDVNHIPSGLKIGSQKKLSDAKRQIQVSMSLVKPEISALTRDQMRQLPKGDTTITKLALAWRYVDNPSSIDQLRYESAYPGAKLWYDSQPPKSVFAEQINPGIAGTKASTANSTTNLHFGEVVYIGDNPQPYKVDRQNGLLIDLDKIPFDDSVGGHRGLSAGPTYDMGRDGPLIRSGFDYNPGDAAIPRRDAPAAPTDPAAKAELDDILRGNRAAEIALTISKNRAKGRDFSTIINTKAKLTDEKVLGRLNAAIRQFSPDEQVQILNNQARTLREGIAHEIEVITRGAELGEGRGLAADRTRINSELIDKLRSGEDEIANILKLTSDDIEEVILSIRSQDTKRAARAADQIEMLRDRLRVVEGRQAPVPPPPPLLGGLMFRLMIRSKSKVRSRIEFLPEERIQTRQGCAFREVRQV